MTEPFTDADLNRLKGDIGPLEERYSYLDVKALLSRLDAAEYALIRFHIIPKDQWTSGIDEAVAKWNASKGL